MKDPVPVDLENYKNNLVKRLNDHLAELNFFLRSIHTAVENFSPNNIKKGSVLPSILPHNPPNQNQFELYPNTPNMAARLAVFGMFAATEECLRLALVPLRATRSVCPEIGPTPFSEWISAWKTVYYNSIKIPEPKKPKSKKYKAIEKYHFGELINEIPTEIRIVDTNLFPSPWDVQKNSRNTISSVTVSHTDLVM